MLAANIGEAGQTIIEHHERIVNDRYTGYAARVQEFIAGKAIDKLSDDLARRYVIHESTLRPSVAMIAHTNVFDGFVGGSEFHVRDLIDHLRQQHVFYVVYPEDDKVGVTALVDGVKVTRLWHSKDCGALLDELQPAVVHIHHLMGYPDTFVNALVAWTGPKDFTIHYYYGLCRHYTLFNS